MTGQRRLLLVLAAIALVSALAFAAAIVAVPSLLPGPTIRLSPSAEGVVQAAASDPFRFMIPSEGNEASAQLLRRRIERDPDRFVPILVRAAASPDWKVRAGAVAQLSLLERPGLEAVFRAASADPDAMVR